MLQTVPSAHQTDDPSAIYAFLVSTYGMSVVKKQLLKTRKTIFFDSLLTQWKKGTFVDFVRKIHQRVSIIFLHHKLTGRTSRRDT